MNQARKRTGTKKVLSMILVLVMLLSLLSMAAFTLPASETGNSKDAYEYNIMFLDCGRKYFSVDSIKQIIDNASAAGFNYIQLAVGNDGLRFLLDDMSLTVGNQTYDSNAVKVAIQKGNADYNAIFSKEGNEAEDSQELRPYNPSVNELTQSDMDTIIAYAKAKGMGVIPCVNTPGHMDAILSAANSLTGTNCSYSGSVRTIDVTNTTAVAFTKALLQKYINYFAGKGCQLFNMGADEYANDKFTGGAMGFGNLQSTGKYSNYVTYVNQVAKMIKDAGMKPMAFNDGIYFNNNTYSGTFDTDIIVCYWSSGWSGYSPMSASGLASKGFRLVNTNGSYYWVLGKNAKCSVSTARGFDKTSFPDKNSSSGNSIISNPAGSMFCIWADYPGAETEANVISKTADTIAAFGATLPKVTSGTVTPTPTTPTPDTNTSTKDIYVAVNGTETKTVSGDLSGTYTTANPDIATVTANAAPTNKELNAVTSIESGKQYLIVNNEANKALSDTSATTTYWSWGKHTVSGLALSGSVSAENTTDLWTIESVGTKYQIKNASGQYLTFGEYSASVGATDSELSLSYSGGSWTIKNGKSYLSRYDATTNDVSAGYNSSSTSNNWTIYEITGGEMTTTLTFHGVAVGTTSVKIGGVTYTIHVTAEDLNNVTPLKLEYWITNAPIDSVTGADSESRDKVLKSEAYKVYFTNIAAKADGVASPDGVDVTRIAPANTSHDNRTVYYWRCRMLDTTLANNSTSKTQQQTADGGDDETMSGVGFTKIRYYGGNWQVFTENNAWVTVDTVNNQLVAYYLENIKVSDEVESFAADWGNRGNGSKGGWLDTSNYCTLSMQVVYEDGTTNPTGTAAADLKSKTIVYGYWSEKNGRGIGTVLLEGQEYEIYKVTSETGAATASFGGESGYDATVTNFDWDDNEMTVWEGDASSSVSIHNDATGFSTEGANANLCWDENKEAILLRVYVRAKVTEDSLTVNYFDENNTSLPFYSYNIAVESGTTFSNQFTYVPGSANENGSLSNNTVVNIKGVTQTVNWQLEKMSEIGAQYRFGNYIFTNAIKETGNKVVNLYYKFNSEKTFVVDFGLPLHITKTDISEKLSQANIEGVTVGNSLYGTVRANDDFSIDYILNKTIDGSDRITVTYTGTKVSGESDSATYNLTIIPATSVYYEDNFASFTNGTGKAADAKWSIVGNDGNVTEDKSTSKNQALTELGKMSADDVYGHDAAYADSTKLSMGSAHKVTVSAKMVKDWTDGSAWPTATFTFKGTGFDIISLTDNTSGAIFVDVYAGKEATGTPVKQLTVNNYYGYKQDGNGKWVVDTERSNALYQIPVMKVSGLDYGEYTAVIRAAYSKFFDTAKKNQYSFWLDAIRVYDPMGKDNATYTKDGEGYPQYIKLRDQLAKENGSVTTNTNLLFIDGAEQAKIATYANYGPNNEVYLAKGQAITFTVPGDANIASVQIGAKAPNGSAAKMVVNSGEAKEIQSATEMYYEIGTEGRNFTIANNGDGILSLTNLKITFTDKQDSTITLTPLSTEEQNAVVMSVRALFAAPEQTFEPEHFTAKWSRNVRKGGTATLTVKASADVEAITVNGEEITAYTTKTARSFWGSKETYHVFTYRVTNAATADYSVCAVNADGVVSDPITATLTVRPSIRDWWNGIFNKWKH